LDIVEVSHRQVLGDKKKMFGASSVMLSSGFVEQDCDEHAASRQVFDYSNIDPFRKDTLEQSHVQHSTSPLDSVQTVYPKESSSERRQTVTRSESGEGECC
jgi:hypothetical protein